MGLSGPMEEVVLLVLKVVKTVDAACDGGPLLGGVAVPNTASAEELMVAASI